MNYGQTFQQNGGYDGLVCMEAENFTSKTNVNCYAYNLYSDISGYSGAGFIIPEKSDGTSASEDSTSSKIILGNNAEGTSYDEYSSGTMGAIRYQCIQDMTVTQMKVKIANSGSSNIKCAIYSDNNGVPGTFLMGTEELTNPGTGWQSFTFTSGLSLTSGTWYHLVVWSDNGYWINYTDGGVGTQYRVLAYGTWPDSFGSSSPYPYATYCIYAEGTVGSAPVGSTIILGNNTEGTSYDEYTSGYMGTVRYQCIQDMTVTQMKVKIANSGSSNIKCAIYSDNDGVPGTFLMGTEELTNPGTGWQSFTFTSGLTITAGTWYHLVEWSANGYWINYTDGGRGTQYRELAYGTWPASFGSSSTWTDGTYCIYAEGIIEAQNSGSSEGFISQFNGNIAAIRWKSSGGGITELQKNDLKEYDYHYDGLNRLTGAQYKNVSVSSYNDSYNEDNITYDLNGNIKSLKRHGVTNNGILKEIDNLKYYYNGNKLTEVRDTADKSFGFIDGNVSGTDYKYDENGNMTTDNNKGITIEYNLLNLPSRISKGSDYIEYTYDAAGTKLSKKVSIVGTVTTIDYCGETEFHNGALKYLHTEEGVVEYQPAQSFTYEYFLKDHLGNTRAVVSADASGNLVIGQVNNYYPFGMAFTGIPVISNPGSENMYQYNGKEKQGESLGGVALDWYDYGARFYDPQIARWHTIDPMFDRHYDCSPYVYVLNNPLTNIDLYGFTDWKAVLKGAATFVVGLGGTIGGCALGCTPTGVGQAAAGVLISTGVPSMGLGVGIMVAGFRDDGTAKNIPGGVNEAFGMAMDKVTGNDNESFRKAGSVVDVAANLAGGVPKTAVEKVSIAILAGDAVNSIAGTTESNNTQTNSGSNPSNTEKNNTAASDNTKVVTPTRTQVVDTKDVKVDADAIKKLFEDKNPH